MYYFISQGMRRTKSETITEPVLLKYSCNICLDYKICLIQIYPFNYSQKLNNYKTNKVGIFCSSSHTTAVHQDHTNLSQGYTSNPAQLHACTVQFYTNCFSSIACNVFIAHQLLGQRGDVPVSLNVKLPGAHTLQNLIENTEQFPVVWG